MPLLPMPTDTDPASLLMSEAAVCRFLGVDGKGVRKLIASKQLRRHETGAFLRSQVQAVHDSIVRSLGAPTTQGAEYRTEPMLS